MGIGDDILATGMARGARARGKRIAFGDGRRIIWGPHSAMVFAHNPNVAPPGAEGAGDVEWVRHYKGHRLYNSAGNGRWIWNGGFRAVAGEFFLTGEEKHQAAPENLILVEPNVPEKPCAPNKQWPLERWRELVELLRRMGLEVRQFSYGRPHKVAPGIATRSFRQAVGLLERCRLAILPEGGLHHAAAAVGAPAIVLFGGFVPPAVLGYADHINLTGGAEACGSFNRCEHCVAAMRAITVGEVASAAEGLLKCR